MILDWIYLHIGLFMVILMFLCIWDMVWKGLGLWHAGKNQQTAWFVCILVFNTMGILPIVYLVWFRPKAKVISAAKAVPAPKAKKKK